VPGDLISHLGSCSSVGTSSTNCYTALLLAFACNQPVPLIARGSFLEHVNKNCGELVSEDPLLESGRSW